VEEDIYCGDGLEAMLDLLFAAEGELGSEQGFMDDGEEEEFSRMIDGNFNENEEGEEEDAASEASVEEREGVQQIIKEEKEEDDESEENGLKEGVLKKKKKRKNEKEAKEKKKPRKRRNPVLPIDITHALTEENWGQVVLDAVEKVASKFFYKVDEERERFAKMNNLKEKLENEKGRKKGNNQSKAKKKEKKGKGRKRRKTGESEDEGEDERKDEDDKGSKEEGEDGVDDDKEDVAVGGWMAEGDEEVELNKNKTKRKRNFRFESSSSSISSSSRMSSSISSSSSGTSSSSIRNSNSGMSSSISSNSEISNSISSSSISRSISSNDVGGNQIGQMVRESMVSFLSGEGEWELSRAEDNPFISTRRYPSSPTSYWDEMRIVGNTHTLLIDLAEAFLITPASEAPCERTLSRLKYMIGDRRGNLKPETLFSMFVVAE
jgi:hypothetical protein